MAKKKARKKTRKASESNRAQPVSNSSVSVTLKRARNGYVISSWKEGLGKDIIYVAKTKKEALEYMSKMVKAK